MNIIYDFFNQKNKAKSEFDSENDGEEFPKFIVLKYLEETCLTKLSPFFFNREGYFN